MALTAPDHTHQAAKYPLDRLLSIFTNVRAGEGITALLMLLSIFVLIVSYSVVKTVGEPLILLGGAAEVRSGALLALPLIALGGYAFIAARATLAVVQWIETAENATDYSIMNTARQLLWLPTTREEKYKAKQLAVRIAGRPLTGAAAALALFVFASPVLAQTTREEHVAAQQAEKATRLQPYQPDGLERRLEMLGGLFSEGRRLYPFIGSAIEGGGPALGPGFRARYRDTGSFDAHAAWSLRNARAAEATLKLPEFANGRIALAVRAQWLDAADMAFYGTGNDSLEADRTGFSYKSTSIGTTARIRATSHFDVGGGFDAIRMETAPAGAAGRLTIEQPNFGRSRLFAEFDSRTSPGYTRRGALYRVEVSDYNQTNGAAYSFRRFDAEARQFIPLLRENWVLAFRALASTTSTAAGSDVPYALLPDLGGSRTLRGYSSWRFRDRNRLLLTGEYRWSAGPLVDMALFVDAGKVAPTASGLTLRGLTTSYGVGMSVHTLTNTVLRIEAARTREGMALGLSFGPSF